MSWLSQGLKNVERGISNIIPHQHSADRRATMEATKQQIDYYQQAKEELNKNRVEAEEEKKQARQKVNEKEIRARQRLYRRGGFLQEPSAAPKDTLG
jgi:hypothetical protein